MQIDPLNGCCGVEEIEYLADHYSAKEAMLDFCKQELWETYYSYETNTTKRESGPLAGHYVFTGVIRGGNDSNHYAQDFAALIRKNKLGQLTVSRAAPNRRNHPTHIIRVWVWQPNRRNLVSWYKKHKEV